MNFYSPSISSKSEASLPSLKSPLPSPMINPSTPDDSIWLDKNEVIFNLDKIKTRCLSDRESDKEGVSKEK